MGVIKFDGIEFESVADVVEYKRLTEKKSFVVVEQEPEQKPEVKVKQKRFKRHYGGAWTTQDDAILMKYIKLAGKKRVSQNLYKEIEKIMPNRTHLAIKTRITTLRNALPASINSTYKKWTDEEQKKLEELMVVHGTDLAKISAHFPDRVKTHILSKIKKVNQNKPKEPAPALKASDSEEYVFPYIEPLAEHSVKIFEQMLQDIITRKGRISMFDAQNHLELKNGLEWRGAIWRDFVENINKEMPKIRKVMVMKNPRGLKIVMDGGYHYIKYED